jgi:cysteine desulfurase
MSGCIYLDYQSTTPLDPRVQETMQPYIEGAFGNPHSEHAFGWEAAEAISGAAAEIADLIGASPGEIIFTSGATEANNLAIQGIARSNRCRGRRIVVSAIEHKCVLNTALWLRKQGFEVDVVPVNRAGTIDLDALEKALGEQTALVSVMFANNEIGVIQPISEISALCQARGIPFHCDAAQAVGKVPVDVTELGVDMLSLSGHKIYGPKGVGALYVSRSCGPLLEPLIIGGAQQDGLRAGTLPTFLCVGLGEACRISGKEMQRDEEHCREMSKRFLDVLRGRLPDVRINGDTVQRLAGNLNICFPGIDADSLISALHGQVAASTGSACNAGLIEPSYVLLALGMDYENVKSSIRFGFGRKTTMEDVDLAANFICDKVDTLGVSRAVA